MPRMSLQGLKPIESARFMSELKLRPLLDRSCHTSVSPGILRSFSARLNGCGRMSGMFLRGPFVPLGKLKPIESARLMSELKGLCGNLKKEWPQRLKPVAAQALTARLKSCPPEKQELPHGL